MEQRTIQLGLTDLGEHYSITENIFNYFHTLFYSVFLLNFPCVVLVSIKIIRGLVVLSADSTTSKYKDYINDIHRIS